MDIEKLEKIEKLSTDVLRLSRNTLLVSLRFMDRALSRLRLHPKAGITFATDGKLLVYDPVHVLQRYRAEKEAPTRDYLHAIMHCVFRHMYVHTMVNQACWNLACDIAVEYSIAGLNLPATSVKREALQKELFDKLIKNGVMMTAEKIYRYYLDRNLSDAQLESLRQSFIADEHDIWYMTESQKASTLGTQSPDSPQSNPDSNDKNKDKNNQSNDKQNQPGDGDGNPQPQENQSGDGSGDPQPESAPDFSTSRDISEKDWQDISANIQVDMETFSKARGDAAGAFLQNLKEVNREKYDYTEFLKKFAVMGEVMKINDDEFDYIFYTYGLQLYKKMPLIEPLEYKEVKRIREFVIAIDTSGSVQGEEVQAFIQKTYNILMSTESFFFKVNVHIIQCDAAVQEHVKITTREEFEAYIRNMRLKGFGGTDFRPVFAAVDELRRNKEFTNLKGLIYFTDGYGTFPEKKPEYETAFVFVQDNYEIPAVPPWAIRLVLQKEDL